MDCLYNRMNKPIRISNAHTNNSSARSSVVYVQCVSLLRMCGPENLFPVKYARSIDTIFIKPFIYSDLYIEVIRKTTVNAYLHEID